MDVIFETQVGSFALEIGYFDTVYEIKEKIQKYKNIPISHQTLIFNGNVLSDNGNVESCIILHHSRIRLLIAPRHEKLPEIPRNKVEEQQLAISNKTQLLFRLPTSKSQLSLEIDLNDSVEQVKEKLHDIEGFPASRIALYVNGNNEMQDHRHLREYELTDGSEIEVSVKPSATALTGTGLATNVPMTGLKKLKVLVLPKCGTKKVIVEANPVDKVQTLRNELEKLQQRVGFQLPPEGYFFIYKQNVMEERETFQWHNVRSGDVIEIFNGSVTGGS